MNRLIQSRETRRERLGKARGMAEIASSLPFVMQDHRRTEPVLSVVERVLERVPVYRLHFRKDASLWDVVQELPPALQKGCLLLGRRPGEMNDGPEHRSEAQSERRLPDL
jgi:hypothetical protein